jgi:peptidoglycan/LPS O-acetylase OafA/YrhL
MNREMVGGTALATRAPTRKQYFDTLDGIRGVAAVMVAIRHMDVFFGPVSFDLSYLAVDLFFVLSGVVIAKSYENRLAAGTLSIRQFLLLRVIRLYPLYVLGTSISVAAVLTGVVEITPAWRFWAAIPFALLLLPFPFATASDRYAYPLNHPAWSLFFELGANTIYALPMVRTGLRWMIALMAISALGLIGLIALSRGIPMNVGWTFLTLPAGVARVGFSFFIGVLLYRQYKRSSRPSLSGWRADFACIAALMAVFLLLAYSPPPALRGTYVFLTVTVLFPGVVYASLFVEPAGTIGRISRFMGTVSYALYAIHQPLSDAVAGALQKLAGLSIAQYAPAAGVVLLPAVVGLCWVIDAIYDLPIRRYLVKKLALSPLGPK